MSRNHNFTYQYVTPVFPFNRRWYLINKGASLPSCDGSPHDGRPFSIIFIPSLFHCLFSQWIYSKHWKKSIFSSRGVFNFEVALLRLFCHLVRVNYRGVALRVMPTLRQCLPHCLSFGVPSRRRHRGRARPIVTVVSSSLIRPRTVERLCTDIVKSAVMDPDAGALIGLRVERSRVIN